MKKMNKPEVEAIRFDSNDVIATSGGLGAGVYYALGSEVEEATGSGILGWYSLDVHPGTTTFNVAGWSDVKNNNGTYVWYENHSWHEGSAISNYDTTGSNDWKFPIGNNLYHKEDDSQWP